MDVGIIGLSQAGKTTVFNAVTRSTAHTGFGGGNEPNVGVVKVPDARLDVLAAMYKPKKVTPAEIRYVDGVFYMSMGQLTSGKFWKLDPADPASPLGDLGSMLDQMDPTAMMKKLEPAIDEVTYEGAEDVDGRSLDHYELTVDGAELGKATEVPPAAMGQLPDSITYDLWLDEEHRMAQATMELPVQGMTTNLDMTVEDWDKDVSIEAPPADQVTDMPDMGALMGQQGQPKV